jgi:hypothetical protein
MFFKRTKKSEVFTVLLVADIISISLSTVSARQTCLLPLYAAVATCNKSNAKIDSYNLNGATILKTQHRSNENEFSRKFSVLQYKKQPVASFVGNYGYL